MLEWKPPLVPNGKILYYLIQWSKGDQHFSTNVSEAEFAFKFPNTSATEKFNVSIRAVNNAGLGNAYLKEISPFDFYMSPDHQVLGILIGIFISLLAVLFCIWMFLRKKHCSKNNEPDTSNPPLPPGQNSLNCTAELHEMQTLITRPENSISTIVPNGNLNHLNQGFKQRPDVTNVNEAPTQNNDKSLKVSPRLSIGRHEMEPLTNGDTIVSTIAELTTFNPKVNGRVSTIESTRQSSIMPQNGYMRPHLPIAVDNLRYSLQPQPVSSQQYTSNNNQSSSTSSSTSSSDNSSSSGSIVAIPIAGKMNGNLRASKTSQVRNLA